MFFDSPLASSLLLRNVTGLFNEANRANVAMAASIMLTKLVKLVPGTSERPQGRRDNTGTEPLEIQGL